MPWRGRAALFAAIIALGYLGVMAASGGRRESRWLVRFAAAGLMPDAPERIDRIEVTTRDRTLRYTRGGRSGWTAGANGVEVPTTLASDIDMSIKFMHVAAPIRVMSRDEWAGQPLEEFGLEPPQYVISLRRGELIVLAGRFGALSPQQVAQYVRVDGREQLYMMPRFIGRQWERVLEAGRG